MYNWQLLLLDHDKCFKKDIDKNAIGVCLINDTY